MTTKDLFDHLVRALTIDVSLSEKRTMITWVLQEELNATTQDIVANNMTAASPDDFTEIIRRLNHDEPLQYILGHAWFYGRKFKVDPSVLIPRPETELLVTNVLERTEKSKAGSLLDVGTGSGCIAITLALELPKFDVTATDFDAPTVELARSNASNLGVPIHFRVHDILTEDLPLRSLDIVVSNPPYIREQEKKFMRQNVLRYEPTHALFVPDADPLLYHRAIAEKAHVSLMPGGLIIMEINEKLGAETVRVVQSTGLTDVKLICDLDGKHRFVTARSRE